MDQKIWKIPLSRLPFYALVIALMPILIVVFLHISKCNAWNEVEQQLNYLQIKVRTSNAKQAINKIVRAEYAASDPSYVEQKIESIACLDKERLALEKLFQKPSFRGNEMAAKRYAFIKGGENKIQFSETSSQTYDGVSETLLHMARPVEIDNDNLKEILSRIEQKHFKQPLLIIKDFSLKRSKNSLGSEVYTLSMTLIKREFSS